MRWIMLMMILLLTFEVRVKEYPFLPDSPFAFERYLTVMIEEEREKFLENGDEKSLLGEVITDLRNDAGYSAQKLNPGVSKWGDQETVYFVNLSISKIKTDSSGSLLYVAHMSHRSKEITFRLTGDSRKRGGDIIENHKTDFVCSGESITQNKTVVVLCQFPDDFLSLVLEKVRADLLSFTQKKVREKILVL